MAPANRGSAASTTNEQCQSRDDQTKRAESGRAFPFTVWCCWRPVAVHERAAYGQSTNTDKF